MNDASVLLTWQPEAVTAAGARLQALGEELVRLLAAMVPGLGRQDGGRRWQGGAAAGAGAAVERRAGVLRRVAAELAGSAHAVLESGQRIRGLQAAVDHWLARARGEPSLEVDQRGRVSVRPWDTLALVVAGPVGAALLAGQELGAAQLRREVDDALAEAQRVDRQCATRCADLSATTRALLRAYEPRQLRADHVGLLGAAGIAGWLQGIPAAGTRPQDVADWWAAHLPAEQAELLRSVARADPATALRLGSLDGLPLDVRDAVNRAALRRRLAGYAAETARLDARLARADGREAALLVRELATVAAARRVDLAVRDRLRELAGARDPVTGSRVRSLLVVDEPRAWGGVGRVAVSVGPADRADHVAYLVPGFGAQPGTDLGNLVGSALNVYVQARSIAPAASVAVVAWLGYRTPGWTQVAFDARARAGARLLARALEGLRAARALTRPHVTLIGHSYGSTTAGLAMRDPAVRVDDAVFVGSPGVLAEHAADLPVPAGHVWVGAASGDEVSRLSRFGVDPAARSFGAHRFPAECPTGTALVAQHLRYFAADSPSLLNVARVVAGLGSEVAPAPGRVDSGFVGAVERLAASSAQVPLADLLGPPVGDPTFADPAR